MQARLPWSQMIPKPALTLLDTSSLITVWAKLLLTTQSLNACTMLSDLPRKTTMISKLCPWVYLQVSRLWFNLPHTLNAKVSLTKPCNFTVRVVTRNALWNLPWSTTWPIWLMISPLEFKTMMIQKSWNQVFSSLWTTDSTIRLLKLWSNLDRMMRHLLLPSKKVLTSRKKWQSNWFLLPQLILPRRKIDKRSSWELLNSSRLKETSNLVQRSTPWQMKRWRVLNAYLRVEMSRQLLVSLQMLVSNKFLFLLVTSCRTKTGIMILKLWELLLVSILKLKLGRVLLTSTMRALKLKLMSIEITKKLLVPWRRLSVSLIDLLVLTKRWNSKWCRIELISLNSSCKLGNQPITMILRLWLRYVRRFSRPLVLRRQSG